jgi:hypothetical protein
MHGVRAAIPRTNPLASNEFATIRDRLIKIGACDRAHRAHPRPAADELSGSGIVPDRRARPHAFWSMSRGAVCPDKPPPRQINPDASHSEWLHTDPAGRIAGARTLNRSANNAPRHA